MILWVCNVVPVDRLVYCTRDESSDLVGRDMICSDTGDRVGTASIWHQSIG